MKNLFDSPLKDASHRSTFIIQVIIVLLLFFLPNVLPAAGAEGQAVSKDKKGGTYFKHNGEGLNKLVERTESKDGETIFTINYDGGSRCHPDFQKTEHHDCQNIL